MHTIDGCPLSTPIPVDRDQSGSLILRFSKILVWAKWFNQIHDALTWPHKTETLQFAVTAAQSSRDYAMSFPAGTVKVGDVPILHSQVPPANSCYTVHISNPNEVVIRFNNYGAVAQTSGLPQEFTVYVIPS